MLHPLIIVTLLLTGGSVIRNKQKKVAILPYLREVFTGVGTTRLLASSGRNDSLDSVLEKVAKLKSLNQVTTKGWCLRITLLDYKAVHIRVPDHAPVLDTDLLEALVDLAELLYTLIERVLGTVHE